MPLLRPPPPLLQHAASDVSTSALLGSTAAMPVWLVVTLPAALLDGSGHDRVVGLENHARALGEGHNDRIGSRRSLDADGLVDCRRVGRLRVRAPDRVHDVRRVHVNPICSGSRTRPGDRIELELEAS